MKRSIDSKVYYTEEEDVLAKWATACQIKCRLHRVAARHYAHHSKNTTVVILILQTCAGSLTLSNDVPHWAQPLVALLQLALAVMLAISSYLKMEQRSESHRSASLAYGEIYKKLSTLLIRRPSERAAAPGIIDNMLQTLIQLDKNSPMLPMSLCDKEARKTHIAERFRDTELPEELNGLATVSVYGRGKHRVEKSVLETVTEVVQEMTTPSTPDSIALSPVAIKEVGDETFHEPLEDTERQSITDSDGSKE